MIRAGLAPSVRMSANRICPAAAPSASRRPAIRSSPIATITGAPASSASPISGSVSRTKPSTPSTWRIAS